MFYNKEIQIYTYGSKDDEHGITRTGYSLLTTEKPIMVDVQPYSSEQAKKDYGYDIECTKRMFCDVIPEITESAIIRYKDKFYKITGIPWDDDYLDVMLLEKKDVKIIKAGDFNEEL